jgi:hypothetical protein
LVFIDITSGNLSIIINMETHAPFIITSHSF